MPATFLDNRESLEWLREVHLPADAPAFTCAILYGNEDAPDRVELFAENDVRSICGLYEADENGDLVKQPTPRLL